MLNHTSHAGINIYILGTHMYTHSYIHIARTHCTHARSANKSVVPHWSEGHCQRRNPTAKPDELHRWAGRCQNLSRKGATIGGGHQAVTGEAEKEEQNPPQHGRWKSRMTWAIMMEADDWSSHLTEEGSCSKWWQRSQTAGVNCTKAGESLYGVCLRPQWWDGSWKWLTI